MTLNPFPHQASVPRPLPGQKQATTQTVSQCVISFGSNLGDRRELVAEAAREIASHPSLILPPGLRTSRLFETPPIGGPGGQEPFLNAVGAFETTAPARDILDLLQQTEQKLGRRRRLRWDARSIDLDVVLHGNLMGGATGLVVPHPRYTARQFVLRPACDVASEFRDPRFGWTLGELSAFLADDIPSLALVTGSREIRQELCGRLQEQGIAIRHASADSPPDRGWIAPEFEPASREKRSIASQSSELEFPKCFRGQPRLLVRIHQTTDPSRWPAPHQMWPSGWGWPEYRLEIDDVDWAVSELASALQSMQCDAEPVTSDGRWWQG
ncbi:MAG: 2-amino-4-hydroxy-6-hydroxymethyldihydropteridine diphosphokinase [Planctomycetota bacterium]